MDGGARWAAVHGVTKSRTRLSDFTFTFHFHALERKWQPTLAFLPGESQGWGSLVGCSLWGRTESDTTEETQQQQQHDLTTGKPAFLQFSRQEYWRGLPFPPPGDLPNPGIEPATHASPALAGGFFTTTQSKKPKNNHRYTHTHK